MISIPKMTSIRKITAAVAAAGLALTLAGAPGAEAAGLVRVSVASGPCCTIPAVS